MVVVFARTVDDNLVSLAKQLNELVKKTPDSKLASQINLLGDDFETLKSCTTKLATDHKRNHAPTVVPLAFKDGPKHLKLNSDAHVTVIIYESRPSREIKANHAFARDGLNDKAINSIVADVKKHLP